MFLVFFQFLVFGRDTRLLLGPEEKLGCGDEFPFYIVHDQAGCIVTPIGTGSGGCASSCVL